MDVLVTWEYAHVIGFFVEEGFKDLEHAEFMFYEGNYSCDCNLSVMTGLAKVYHPEGNEKCGDAWPCGKTIKVLEVCIYNDSKSNN